MVPANIRFEKAARNARPLWRQSRSSLIPIAFFPLASESPGPEDIRRYGTAVFAALPLLLLLIFQGIRLYEKGNGTGFQV
ncbi:hypothetical protein HF313_17080 [Massilia atriviolacea]|uniref:Uncharacterized protein n=1 Tax=Massilia atriviolacea TaxID=2495579 RepID=A0A430HUE3_9BURK|nr:hypothetical protein [Massilia atriviolacea]RSZ60994.1 hypothetical protein EJB06_02330 [Massilia atriviolacea]